VKSDLILIAVLNN